MTVIPYRYPLDTPGVDTWCWPETADGLPLFVGSQGDVTAKTDVDALVAALFACYCDEQPVCIKLYQQDMRDPRPKNVLVATFTPQGEAQP